jgi:(1->4)-alpha-D-glucan 1-alpha-D-glucosylmutase
MIRATMRLQFHGGFTFVDAEKLVPYFAALGVSHVYASPITTARPGSVHGYDVIDPAEVNPELGGEVALRRLVAALRTVGLGLIIDIVPNHMAAVAGNAWWFDVLKHGAASRYANYFDIDWDAEDPELRRKVLLPVLGRSLRDAIAAEEITLLRSDDGFAAQYFTHVFPISDRHRADIERLGLPAFDAKTTESRQRLATLLREQNYRLASWRVANDEINWRRFFDINELAGLRMENPEAFEDVHALVFRLYTEGLIDGVRVDHIDGLADPAAYCGALRQRLDALTPQRPHSVPRDRPYVVVEKILLRGENLPKAWHCDGTSGYDFMEDVSALQHDDAAEPVLARTWSVVSGRAASFAPEEQAARREIIARSFTAQLESCVRAFHALARRQTPGGDLSRAAIRRAVIELLVHFPIYRAYGTARERPDSDKPFLQQAFTEARETALSGDRDALDWLEAQFATIESDPALIALQETAVIRFQQLSAPIAAKAVEDTAAYRYGRLLSRNDVGFDIARLGIDVAQFHARSGRRHRDYPNAMLATATHDHKRGEDVRARLAVISEMPDEWARVLPDWIARIAGLRRPVGGAATPTAGDIAMLLQMVVGAWPLDLAIGDDAGRAAFAQRLAGWQEKALREAKLATDWTSPNAPYESAARELLAAFVARCEQPGLLDDVVAFSRGIGPAGAVNGLAQVLLKLTAPGVPDLYQGTDYWDFSLVDPDNRRPVDFAARRASLGSIDIEASLADWRDGRIKQAVIARTLALRREHPQLFAAGSYEPIAVTGARANHLVAFARRLDSGIAIVAVPRFSHALLGAGDGIVFDPCVWKDTALAFEGESPVVWRSIFDDRMIDVAHGRIAAASILRRCPVALLMASP